MDQVALRRDSFYWVRSERQNGQNLWGTIVLWKPVKIQRKWKVFRMEKAEEPRSLYWLNIFCSATFPNIRTHNLINPRKSEMHSYGSRWVLLNVEHLNLWITANSYKCSIKFSI